MIEIKLLDKENEGPYSGMLDDCAEAMLFQSIRYRDLLVDFIGCQYYYLVAVEDGQIIGALPSCIKQNEEYGNVLNSLPFFGSHGGCLVRRGIGMQKGRQVRSLLLGALNDLAEQNDCVISVIVTSPFEKDPGFYEENANYMYKDSRVAQIVRFREGAEDAEKEIMYGIVDPENRRSIRRPLKNGIMVEYSRDFRPLYEMHNDNISTKGGAVKPLDFFEKVEAVMDRDDYDLMYAKMGDMIIAGLLIFYFKDIVEYYTPALRYEFAIEQGTSLLIFEGMKQAIKRGFRFWNFGGTSQSQPSLHKFKSKWGAVDYPYYYYIIQHRPIDKLLKLKAEEIIKQYKWFYVVPFNMLKV